MMVAFNVFIFYWQEKYIVSTIHFSHYIVQGNYICAPHFKQKSYSMLFTWFGDKDIIEQRKAWNTTLQKAKTKKKVRYSGS